MSVFEYLQTPEALNAFSLGAASGMMFGGIGVAKDVLDNFSRRAEAQVDMVDRAVAKDDIDFIPKMEVLVQKEAIAQETVDAVKQLLELKVSEEKGVTYDEWVQQGQNERRAKLEEVRTKLQEFNNKRKEEEQMKAIENDVKAADQKEFKVEGVTKITEAQKERVKVDLEDTKRLLAKELSYSKDLQKPETIDRYTKHIQKLEGIIET